MAYICAMFTFIELEPFARAREAMLSDSEFAGLQMHLMAQPEAGDVIPGSDGCRKLRWALAGRDNIDPKLLRELRRHYEKNRNS